jgi:hypothetical protein
VSARRVDLGMAGLVALLGLLAGCGRPVAQSPAGPPLAAPERADLVGLAATLARVDDDLAQAFPAGAAPDCDRACLLQRHICALADRVCAIAARHPGDDQARALCRDSRERCQRAQARVAERCRCL